MPKKRTKKKPKELNSLWSHIWEAWRTRCHVPKERYQIKDKLVKSIYPVKDKENKLLSVGGYCKKFWWVQYVFKYKLFVPMLLFCDRILGKYIDDEPEPEWYNKNLIIWNQSWKKAMNLMSKFYNPNFANPKKHTYIEYNTVRRLWNTLSLNDTATREFMNLFMHELTMAMGKAYEGHKEVYHVLYTGHSSYSVIYFTFAQTVMMKNQHPKDILQKEHEALQERAKQVLASTGVMEKEVKNPKIAFAKAPEG